MSDLLPVPPTFWRTVAILLGAARRRAVGRRMRQRELFRQRTGRLGGGGGWGLLFTVVFALAANGFATALTWKIVQEAKKVAAEQNGRLVVGSEFAQVAKLQFAAARRSGQTPAHAIAELDDAIDREAERLATRDERRASTERHEILGVLRSGGAAALLDGETFVLGLRGLPAMLGSLALLAWSAMLVFNGEGLELDVQRSRHPMWEWLSSHPVPPGAVFLAEMLAPLATNPVYWFAPIVPGFLYGCVYGQPAGLAAAALVGVPILVAAACLGKALEVLVLLRAAPRTRGALIGLMGWLGYVCGALMFLSLLPLDDFVKAVAPVLRLPATLPWPWLGLLLGERLDGGYSFSQGVATCALVSGGTIAGSVALTAAAARWGLSGVAGESRPRRQARFGRYAAYRKELIWFTRDRSALVQAILVPLSLASFQLVNLRGVLAQAQGRWSYLSGAAVLLGTYFLTVLGPKSLTSEGSTLWLALSWPLGLEGLLKAKARLWAALSSIIVALALGYAVWSYPQAWWKIVLVGVGWAAFSIAMADKSVTLAQVTSDSGEVQGGPSRGRRWATQLGTLSFAIGVLTENAPLAITGIVYAFLTASAMWQNFRAHLPFLLDPWSERLPQAPTLMHAMIAIAALVDGGAILTGIGAAVAGKNGTAIAQTVAYGLAAAAVAAVVAEFLSGRGVSWSDVWTWRRPGASTLHLRARLFALLAGIGLGLTLGLGACLYETLLLYLPITSGLLRRATKAFDTVPYLRPAYAVSAVLIAPLAEEYLFRGLLFRALDREWGGWRAVAGSALFFASYHPFLAWLPVGALGALNATLFKRTGWLVPAVAAHMTYNAVVVGWTILRPG